VFGSSWVHLSDVLLRSIDMGGDARVMTSLRDWSGDCRISAPCISSTVVESCVVRVMVMSSGRQCILGGGPRLGFFLLGVS
jgi:hypothetical protein